MNDAAAGASPTVVPRIARRRRETKRTVSTGTAPLREILQKGVTFPSWYGILGL